MEETVRYFCIRNFHFTKFNQVLKTEISSFCRRVESRKLQSRKKAVVIANFRQST